MATTTPNMSLTAWDTTADPYDHAQQASNFETIDLHDHSAGKGKQIPTAGLTDAAVTTPKLADGAITGAKLADGAVTYAKLGSDGRAWSLGDIKWQFFPSGASAIYDANWHIADGTTLAGGQHDWNGGFGVVALPNLIDKVAYGVDVTRVGNTGGNNSLNLAHSHTVNAHSHTVNAHSHIVNAHSHTVNAHNHLIVADGSHHHLFVGGALLHTRQANTTAKSPPTGLNDFLQSVYVAGFNSGQGDAVVDMDDSGSHNHTGATDVATPGTSSSSPATSDATPGTSGASPGTSSSLGALDTRPAWTGLLPLIRIRN